MSNTHYSQQDGQYRIIPGAGTYLQDQAKAQSAYERARASLQTQRSQKQITTGLGKDWQVDPHAQYGTYQAMLQGQGGQLQAAQEQAQQRGFFGRGLGNQGESALRYGQAVESLGFKNNLVDYENQYQASMGDLERAKQEADLAALQGARSDAYADEDYTEYADEEPVIPPTGGNKPPVTSGSRPGTKKGNKKPIKTVRPFRESGGQKKRPRRGGGGTTYRSM